VCREHALLVRSLGVSQLVVAVNKLDTVNWAHSRFKEIQDKLRVFLTKQVTVPTSVPAYLRRIKKNSSRKNSL
jgi:translation elongation factor EF-1alpha